MTIDRSPTAAVSPHPILADDSPPPSDARGSRRHCVAVWLAATWGTVGLWLQLSETSADGVPGKSIVWVVVLVALLCVGLRVPWQRDRRVQGWAAILAGAFAISCVLGAQLARYEALDHLAGTGAEALRSVATVTGLAAAFWLLLVPLLGACQRQTASSGADHVFLGRAWRSMWPSMAIMLLAWLPFYSAQAPGLVMTDSTNQILMTLGDQPLTNHHPVIHTLVIGGCLWLGQLVGSLSLGVAIYTLGQMALLAFAFALAVRYAAVLGAPTWLRAALLAYFSLGHMNQLNAVTMWKDTPHAIVTLLLVILLFTAVRRPAAFWSRRSRVVAFVVLAFLFCTFRNNGLYAFVLFVPVLLIVQRRHWRRIVPALAAVVVLLIGYQVLIFGPIGAKGGSVREALSVPLQQIARVDRDDRAQLSAADRASITALFNGAEPGALYNPHSSDPVKAAASAATLQRDPGRYVGMWFRLGLAHPDTYLTSFLANSYGYWYPDSTRQSVNQSSVNYVAAKGVAMTPWNGFLGIMPPQAGAYLAFWDTTPLLSMAGSMGFMVWLIAIAAVVLALKRRTDLLLPFALLALLWLTVLASPLWGDFRYLYGVIVSGPTCLTVALTAKPRR